MSLLEGTCLRQVYRNLVLPQDELREGLHQGTGIMLPFVLSVGRNALCNGVRGYREAVQF